MKYHDKIKNSANFLLWPLNLLKSAIEKLQPLSEIISSYNFELDLNVDLSRTNRFPLCDLSYIVLYLNPVNGLPGSGTTSITSNRINRPRL